MKPAMSRATPTSSATATMKSRWPEATPFGDQAPWAPSVCEAQIGEAGADRQADAGNRADDACLAHGPLLRDGDLLLGWGGS